MYFCMQVVQLFESHQLLVIELLSSPSSQLDAVCVLEVLLHHISSLSKSREQLTSMYPSHLLMLLRVVEHLLKLCHHVESEKGWAVQHLGETLSNIFRTTYSLLKVNMYLSSILHP